MDDSLASQERELEALIQAAMDVPDPTPQFFAELGDKLDARSHAMAESASDLRNQEQPKPRSGLFWRPLWQIAVVFLIVLGLAILAIGPQRVAAQVQSWLSYTGWFGFVELDQTWVLSAPVQQEQNGVVVTVTEVIATPERVAIRLTSRTSAGSPVKLDPPFTDIKLLLTGGKELEAATAAASNGEGIFEFPGLPTGMDQITLVIPPDEGTEKDVPWELPLSLQPAAQSMAGVTWPAAYRPKDGRASVNGLTMEVLAVVQTSQVTALQVKFTGENTGAFNPAPQAPQGQLFDNLGHAYQPSSAPSYENMNFLGVKATVVTPIGPHTSDETSTITAFTFAPLSPAASQATFSFDEVQVDVPAQASFTFDPGPNPQVGQVWDLDNTVAVAGARLHFNRARLTTIPGDIGQNEPEEWYVLTFWADSPIQDGRRVSSVEPGFEFPSIPSDRMTIYGSSTGQIEIQLYYRQLPTGSIQMTIHKAGLVLYGPWEVRWNLPKSGKGFPLRSMSPENSAVTVHGITLQAQRVIASDRLTAVNLALLGGLPQGSTTWQIVEAPSFGDVYLEDATGKHYQQDEQVVWDPGHNSESYRDPHQLTFPAAPRETPFLSLNIPAITYDQPVQGNFEVEVPVNPDLAERSLDYRWTNPDGSYQTSPVQQLASDPWEVDIPLRFGDYQLHFDQARLVRPAPGGDTLILHGEWLSGIDESRLPAGFHVAWITRPNGERVSTSLAGLGREDATHVNIQSYREEPGSPWEVELHLPVTDPSTGKLLPGRYRLEVDAASLVTPGPWKISWPMKP
jgi:hypothetical protein